MTIQASALGSGEMNGSVSTTHAHYETESVGRECRKLTIKRILVATDFSDGSYGALSYAKQLAKAFNAKIILLHVIDRDTASTATQSAPDLCERFDLAEAELERIGSSLFYDNIACAMVARSGDIRKVVPELVRERNIDLLVIGTYGRTGKGGRKLGSIAEMLLRSLPCPVLTVGAGARSNAYRSAYKHCVLFPTDFARTAQPALAYAECLAAHLDGELLLLHIDDGLQIERKGKALESLANELTNLKVRKECIVRTGIPSDAIVALAIEKRVDFIVMGVHGPDEADKVHNYGTAFDVISKSKCPVFTLSSIWK